MRYDYIKAVNPLLLDQQVIAIGLAGYRGYSVPPDSSISLYFAADLSSSDHAALDVLVANHDASQQTATQAADAAKAAGLKAQRTAASSVALEIEALPDTAPLQAGKLKPLTKYLRSIALLD